MSIRRVNHGRYHSYVDIDTGEKIPSVTTVTGDGIPKPALLKWSAEATANYAVDNWAALTGKAPSVRLKELYGARYAERDKAANRGTQVHALASQLVHGHRVAVPDDIAGHVQSYVRFLDDFDVDPVLVEAVVVSHAHRYCGTLDLVADLLVPDDLLPGELHRQRWLLDIKTSRSGIFGETALQVAGYRYADAYLDADGNEVDMPEVERTGGLHVRADGYDLVSLVAEPAQHRAFLYAKEIALTDLKALVGVPIVPPTTSTYRLAKADDEDGDR